MVNEPVGAAELAAAGVYDPAAADASQRLALLEFLVGVGATIDDLVATPPEELPVLASTIALWGDRRRLTIDELAEAARVDGSLIARAWRAAGLPEPDRYSDVRTFLPRDVEVLEVMRAGIDVLGLDVTMQLLRVLGAAAAKVADASVSAFFVNVVPRAVEEDESGLALARANAESMVLLDGLTAGFDTLLRHHIERAFRPLDELSAVRDVDLVVRSVGFADLVDSTAWTQQLELPELARALNEFDATASDVVARHGGRVVKLIGDEVMFASADPRAAVEIALRLIDAFASHEVLPPVRAGVATGEVLARDGDYSGAVVNRAARAAKIAARSTLLVDSMTRDGLRESPAFACGNEGSHSLKGFAEPVPLVQITRARRG